jgi:hypothetical protein
LAFRSAIVPLTAVSDTKATIGPALAAAGALGAHLDAVFVRPDPEQMFVYTGLQPVDLDLAAQPVRDKIDANGRDAAERARRDFYRTCKKANVPGVAP